ncbi:MAG TPA: (2,3-dihydroxybenzoyl)adenylate synthase [Geminicoccus sp.]|uniref:(2,3-dihydroxybenzoyl)adenylate synthase n=1 Tax=Geminicoccus sp. TaxID=2024832 RepID=UPI002C19789A|nr:(2,3-dihydroxybenzoyl)adenylate synthase [Geminicoccus sp.]HWL67936.1 (2,3-dihydroxybenzoyl)adenylate synthase [Geminicoccus sp.]
MVPVQQVWPEEFARRYRERGYWQGETFGGFLRQRARQLPDRVAVVGGGDRWTYAELDLLADRVAAGLLAAGLEAGDRVVVQLPNVAAFFPLVFGMFRAGILPVFALPAHRQTEIVHLAQRSEACAYVIAERQDGFDYRTLARTVLAEVPAIRRVVVVGEPGDLPGAISFAELAATTPGAPLPEPSPSAVAFMQISGGSTGLSKLIPRTHDDYIYSFRASAEICQLDPNSVYLTVLPVAHNFPMSSPGVFGVLHAGGRVVLSPSPSPDVAFPLIEQERVTITGMVPPLALLWLQAAASRTADLSSLKLLQVGGAKLAPEIARRIGPTLGVRLQQVFGMAEGLVNYTRHDDPDELVINTQGRPISPDDEVLVVDDQGRPVPDGEPGHLLTRGPYTIRGYHNDPGANARAFTEDGFYRTGDIVRRLPSGHLEVQGRATDHINRAGEKISAEEIEDHLLAHPDVFDAAVVSVPDEYLGERSCAFIIPNGRQPRAVEIKAWIRSRGLAEFKVPDQVVFVGEFTATAVGKISRRELRAILRQRLAEADR